MELVEQLVTSTCSALARHRGAVVAHPFSSPTTRLCSALALSPGRWWLGRSNPRPSARASSWLEPPTMVALGNLPVAWWTAFAEATAAAVVDHPFSSATTNPRPSAWLVPPIAGGPRHPAGPLRCVRRGDALALAERPLTAPRRGCDEGSPSSGSLRNPPGRKPRKFALRLRLNDQASPAESLHLSPSATASSTALTVAAPDRSQSLQRQARARSTPLRERSGQDPQ